MIRLINSGPKEIEKSIRGIIKKKDGKKEVKVKEIENNIRGTIT